MNQPTTPNTVEVLRTALRAITGEGSMPVPALRIAFDALSATDEAAAILADRAQRPTVAGSVDTELRGKLARAIEWADEFGDGNVATSVIAGAMVSTGRRLAPAAPSEIEAAVELPPKPEGDLGYYASSLNGGVKQWKYSEAALTTYATEAILKDRASMKGNK